MKDENEFETFVRSALEEGAEVDMARLRALERLAALAAASRRRRAPWRWGVPLVVAASLALAVAFAVLFTWGNARGDGAVSEAIGLLCELDGIPSGEFAADSAGEQLLAWQEAPCADCL